ncbi:MULTISPECIES: hypothetical protein [Halostella]|uniref:DUF5789 family protein n=1 Tax=Halostella TaxID=1843185 RepID=UPI001081BD95|nr:MULTISPECIES: hypothetical protein [Halostella]
MTRTVTRNQMESLLDDLSYPVMRIDAAREFADVTLQLGDGEVNLGGLVSETKNDAFDSIDDLKTELDDVLESDHDDVLPGEVTGLSGRSESDG